LPSGTRFNKSPLDLRGPRAISTQPLLLEFLGHLDENLRWWAVQLLCEDKNPTEAVLQRFATMAQQDKSPFVRLALASALQRIPNSARWPIAQALVSHAEDVADPNLPLMIWYGVEAAVPGNRSEAMRLAGQSKIPLVREFIVRRLTAP
ncbi:MAG TPA: HEAT repeat domain-containing protein, partial [Candidatus Limnocylindria bacterium]|nr:HEAT repeat domain-containing protein [Candidatus Limnocylindria bacterium]